MHDHPFWRQEGFSGQTAAPGTAAEVTLDASPITARPGVLACFSFGPVARRLAETDAAERRDAVIEAMTARVGPRARQVREVIETSWFRATTAQGRSVLSSPMS